MGGDGKRQSRVRIGNRRFDFDDACFEMRLTKSLKDARSLNPPPCHHTIVN